MINTGKYYVMYNDVSYIDEHNIATGEKTRIYTGWTPNTFTLTNTYYPKLISMAIDLDYIYVLYNGSHNLSGKYYVNKFNYNLEFISVSEINVGIPTSIASDLTNLYLAYKTKNGVNKVSLVDTNFTPTYTINTPITEIFGADSNLYGFEQGTITGDLYKIDVKNNLKLNVKQKAQKTGPDYGIQREKFYGYSYPGYLEYDLRTGDVLNENFVPSYNNYVLATLSSSDWISKVDERIIITGSMFMVLTVQPTYPAIDKVEFQEQSGFVAHENYSPNTDLYIGEW